MENPIESILSRIEFRFVGEQDPGRFDISEGANAPAPYQAADVANTYLKDPSCPLLKDMEFMRLPRGITIAQAYVLNQLVKFMPPDRVYLNLGVWHGFSYFAGVLGNPSKQCVGVDHFSEFPERTGKSEFYRAYDRYRNSNTEFHEKDFRDYFRTHQARIGVYFYDGEHSFRSQMEGLLLAAPYFSVGTHIAIDDVNRPEVYKSIVEFLGMDGNFNKYEIVLDKKTVTGFHPTWHCGFTVLRKVRD